MADKAVTEGKGEKVLEAARTLFMRHGFKRVTMGDIAEVAGMSRPALYLVFPSKEEIFVAVMLRWFAQRLSQVRDGLDDFVSPYDKLVFAFEMWSVRAFQMVLAYPDAHDLLESSYTFAEESTRGAYAEFETIVAQILAPLVAAQSEPRLSAAQIARVLVSSIPGLKAASKDAEQLRALFADLFILTLAALSP